MHTKIYTYRQLGDREACDALILRNLPLVKQALGRLLVGLPEHVDRENLHSAGLLGLVEAARSFDSSRGVYFPVFAYSRIRGAILDELRRNCPLPQQVLQQWTRIRSAMEQLPPPVTTEAIAEATGYSVDDIEQCLVQVRLTRTECYHDEEEGASYVSSKGELDEQMTMAEKAEYLANAIEQLPEDMRIALTCYYRDGLRMKEIGAVLELSESRVSRIIAAAELRLRSLLAPRFS